MKKTILVIATSFAMTSVFAQDLKSKKDESILPEADDWSIGIDATPVLQYVGNFLGTRDTINTAPTWNNYGLNQTIVGKLFVDEETAYRGIVRIGLRKMNLNGNPAKAYALPGPAYPTVPPPVEDKAKLGSKYIGLGAGIEKRRGKTRLQGFYGGDAFIWLSSNKSKYEYGNALTQGGAVPNVNVDSVWSTSFWSATGEKNIGVGDGSVVNASGRLIERKSGTTIGIGIRGFIGAEFFILPKISIGGEFGWGIGFYKRGKGKQTVESEYGNPEATAQVETETPGMSGIILDVDRNAANGSVYNFIPSGTLRLNLHF